MIGNDRCSVKLILILELSDLLKLCMATGPDNISWKKLKHSITKQNNRLAQNHIYAETG